MWMKITYLHHLHWYIIIMWDYICTHPHKTCSKINCWCLSGQQITLDTSRNVMKEKVGSGSLGWPDWFLQILPNLWLAGGGWWYGFSYAFVHECCLLIKFSNLSLNSCRVHAITLTKANFFSPSSYICFVRFRAIFFCIRHEIARSQKRDLDSCIFFLL